MKSFSIPNISILRLEQEDTVITSGVTSITGNGDINYGGAGQGTRASARPGIWD